MISPSLRHILHPHGRLILQRCKCRCTLCGKMFKRPHFSLSQTFLSNKILPNLMKKRTGGPRVLESGVVIHSLHPVQGRNGFYPCLYVKTQFPRACSAPLQSVPESPGVPLPTPSRLCLHPPPALPSLLPSGADTQWSAPFDGFLFLPSCFLFLLSFTSFLSFSLGL